jgi:hypothetical protein
MRLILRQAEAVINCMAATAKGDAAGAAAALACCEAPDAWGCTDGKPPELRALVKLLDERMINAMQVRGSWGHTDCTHRSSKSGADAPCSAAMHMRMFRGSRLQLKDAASQQR